MPVLAKTKAKAMSGGHGPYVHDDRPFGSPAPPAAPFRYSRDRRHDPAALGAVRDTDNQSLKEEPQRVRDDLDGIRT